MNHNKKWYASPYIIWSGLFIIVPLFIVMYYGLTNQEGSFDSSNFALIFDSVNRKALWLSI